MRRQRWGRVVNVGSIAGKLTLPGGGAYHAAKHAVEALSDALRFELREFGVEVALIEPGLIRTNFADTAATSIFEKRADPPTGTGPYDRFNESVFRATRSAYEKGLLIRLGGGPDAVAKVIVRGVAKRHLRPRTVVTASGRLLLAIRRFSSDRLWDFLMSRNYAPHPRPTGVGT